MWYYPVYETPKSDLTIIAILEYDEDDIQYEPAPIKGFYDDEYVITQEIVQHAYINRVEDHYDDYYLEEGYRGEQTLKAAQKVLIKYIFN